MAVSQQPLGFNIIIIMQELIKGFCLGGTIIIIIMLLDMWICNCASHLIILIGICLTTKRCIELQLAG